MNKTQAKNAVEDALLALRQEEITFEAFIEFVVKAQVFVPVENNQRISGFQDSTIAKPLVIQDDEDKDILILFSSPERAKVFLAHYPNYQGGILAEFSWVLSKVGYDIGISINPEDELGIDFVPDLVALLKKHCIAN